MKKTLIVMFLISFLFLLSSAYACVRISEAILLNDTTCKGDISGVGDIRYWPVLEARGNKTKIIESLQKYKNYTYRCYVPNNQQGDEKRCISCAPNCSDFLYRNRDTFYADWECTDIPLDCYGSPCPEGLKTGDIRDCEICHWQYVKTLSLTDNDIETIADFLSNGYSVMKQTQEEYQIFLENADRVNNDLSTCDYYQAIAYKNGWTGYIFNDESEKTFACAHAPRSLCGGGGSSNIIWNDLKPLSTFTNIKATLLNFWWLFIVVIAIVIGIIFKTLKK
jgi:hypothetical protein